MEPDFMRIITRRIALFLMLALFIASFGIAVTGCNTVEGAGEDIGEAGEAIEDAAD
jgi:predicted small secreted protein